MEHLTYQQILAEHYEENAKKLLVQQQDYQEEDVDAYDKDDYDENELADKELFNRFQPRHSEDNIIQPSKAAHDPLRHKVKFRTRVLNIDGKFRGFINPINNGVSVCTGNTILTPDIGADTGTSSSYFVFLPSRVFKNVTSIKLTSLEFPNVFYTFSAARGNTMLYIDGAPITIKEGNYTPSELVTVLNSSLPTGVTVQYSSNTNKFTFSKTSSSFSLTFPVSTNPNGNGIGYNLGFSSLSPSATGSSPYTYVSDQFVDTVQDTYVYLAINDYNLVEHQEYGQTHFDVFAKITLPTGKGSIIYDNNYTNSSTKEYHFAQPVNVSKFEIKVLDAYGQVLDLQGANFSMTLELQEVIDSALYEKMREL